MIDLRSDTITKPTEAMRAAMAGAEVGDDVFGDDPTVNALEAKVAELLGKEAAVFVPSGTMANQIAIAVHTRPGDEILIDGNAHVYYYEAGGTAALSGVLCHTIDGDRVVFTREQVEAKLRPEDVHFARAKVICIENTTNRGGGKVWSIEEIGRIGELAKREGMMMHMDGARLWNAAVASGISEKEWAGYFDTVSVCFSKGLGAPMGSALVGSKEVIGEARRVRKRFGGGMRQAGIVAAGALYALEHHRERLVEDHDNAKVLAEGLAKLEGIVIDPNWVETNIVVFDLVDRNAFEFEKELREAGVDVLEMGPRTIRMVTSLEVNREDIDVALETVKGLLV